MDVKVLVVVAINAVLLAFLVAMSVQIYLFRRSFNNCTQRESDYCYTIHCPVDNPKQGPCFGFASRKLEDGNYYCSTSPRVKVDKDGKPVKGT